MGSYPGKNIYIDTTNEEFFYWAIGVHYRVCRGMSDLIYELNRTCMSENHPDMIVIQPPSDPQSSEISLSVALRNNGEYLDKSKISNILLVKDTLNQRFVEKLRDETYTENIGVDVI